jgi:hypothetical protein
MEGYQKKNFPMHRCTNTVTKDPQVGHQWKRIHAIHQLQSIYFTCDSFNRVFQLGRCNDDQIILVLATFRNECRCFRHET